jgi:exonuclease 3'-5' domain-containing protein 1
MICSDPAVPKIKLVDSWSTLYKLLKKLNLIPNSSPPIFINLEGNNLGRNSYISILSLYAVHKGIIYLVDVYKLGKATFSNPWPS